MKKIIWLYGQPGAGKKTLMDTLDGYSINKPKQNIK